MARKKIIPKRIGSVKIPKKLRKFGDGVLADPRAREVAGSALLALGSALLARGGKPGSILRNIFDRPTETARAARDAGTGAASKAGEAVSGMADTVAQAVGDVLDTIRRDVARKIRPVRPRHAHDEHGDGEEKREGEDDRLH